VETLSFHLPFLLAARVRKSAPLKTTLHKLRARGCGTQLELNFASFGRCDVPAKQMQGLHTRVRKTAPLETKGAAPRETKGAAPSLELNFASFAWCNVPAMQMQGFHTRVEKSAPLETTLRKLRARGCGTSYEAGAEFRKLRPV
jgi:hypothetical protein